MMQALDWISSNYIILIGTGGVILLSVGIASFLFRTAWGHWHKGRGRRYERLRGWDATHKHYE